MLKQRKGYKCDESGYKLIYLFYVYKQVRVLMYHSYK